MTNAPTTLNIAIISTKVKIKYTTIFLSLTFCIMLYFGQLYFVQSSPKVFFSTLDSENHVKYLVLFEFQLQSRRLLDTEKVYVRNLCYKAYIFCRYPD